MDYETQGVTWIAWEPHARDVQREVVQIILIELMVYSSPSPQDPLLTLFHYYVSVFGRPVYYRVDDSNLPSHNMETCGCWAGIAKHVGHAITFKVLTEDTQNILFHYNICSAQEPMELYLRLDPLYGEPYPFVRSLPYRGNQIVSHLYDSSKQI